MEEKIYFQAIVTNFRPPNQKIFTLYKKYKSFKKIFEITEKEFKFKKDWEEEYKKLKEIGGEIILRKEKEFPEKLRKIKEPVLGIFVLGKLNLDFPLTIGIVGTRKASSLGKKTAFEFSQNLAQIGVLIVSGLAYGIDLSAHQGAIEAKKENIAVIGCGLDLILKDPRKKFIEKILEVGGAIISEYPLGTPALPENFPLRNRIVAGLSDGILIIEAPIDSGALITARYALNYGKDIFVIPGSIYDKNYLGSLRLIQQGANLVIETEDILRAFDFKIPQKIKNLSLAPKEKEIVEVLKNGGLTIAEISQKTKIDLGQVLALLSHLEIKGIVFNQGGKFYLAADLRGYN
ncbi:MAG: DNA processing protein DprA [Candidatus Parcubacteria bacterium]|nr:MAG: DNA processing protein DprA [Candidatus Parcubacteria bacterium]